MSYKESIKKDAILMAVSYEVAKLNRIMDDTEVFVVDCNDNKEVDVLGVKDTLETYGDLSDYAIISKGKSTGSNSVYYTGTKEEVRAYWQGVFLGIELVTKSSVK